MIRPGVREPLVISVWQQILAGGIQSAQTPVLVQGVCAFTRMALGGAAMVRTLCRALSTESHILFILASTMTCDGPKARQATRLAAPSILTSSPSLVKALVLIR